MDGWAELGGRRVSGVVDVTSDPAALDSAGLWAVVATFEGALTCVRFAERRTGPPPHDPPWQGPPRRAWRSSLGPAGYRAGVAEIRRRIARGAVYQVNLCRRLGAPLPDPREPRLAGLHAALATGNPAPYRCLVEVPALGLHVASASPELFLARDGRRLRSDPMKGTGRTAADLRPKDTAENVMIVDLVRNDLSRVAATGSVEVERLCAVEQHPGLVQLVSSVRAELAPGLGWGDLLAATSPPGSVSGAPKQAALEVIGALEPVPRGVYCGAVGWVDADRAVGRLAVAIRTFWVEDGTLWLGTGAGVTWGSDPAAEWAETELKTARLLEVASS